MQRTPTSGSIGMKFFCFVFMSLSTSPTMKIYQFRMLNAGGSPLLELIVVDSQNNPACTYREIAFDGIYLDQARVPAFNKTLLPPAGRADWLIVCNTAGTYQV